MLRLSGVEIDRTCRTHLLTHTGCSSRAHFCTTHRFLIERREPSLGPGGAEWTRFGNKNVRITTRERTQVVRKLSHLLLEPMEALRVRFPAATLRPLVGDSAPLASVIARRSFDSSNRRSIYSVLHVSYLFIATYFFFPKCIFTQGWPTGVGRIPSFFFLSV